MRISAIVTTYRRFWKCCRAIDSILAQTHPVDEVVVVDNGSPEPEYHSLHDRYADTAVPITVVRLSRGTHTQEPLRDDAGREISIACRDTTNVGFCLARGDWFAMCHDDDEWMPHRIERQVQAMQRHPECLLFNASIINRTEDGCVHGIHHDYYGPHGVQASEGVTDVTGCVPHFNPMAVSALLFSRKLTDALGGWQHWVPDDLGMAMRRLAASDWDFYRRAATTTRLLRLDEPLVYYEVGNVKHEGHMSYA